MSVAAGGESFEDKEEERPDGQQASYDTSSEEEMVVWVQVKCRES